jgi:hypothetical protein
MSNEKRLIQISDDNMYYCCTGDGSASIYPEHYEAPLIYLDDKNKQLEQELKEANRKLKRIASMAGNPDAQEACRLIIAETVKGDNSYDELNDINLMINKILKGDE